jgi:hypothetical protein
LGVTNLLSVKDNFFLFPSPKVLMLIGWPNDQLSSMLQIKVEMFTLSVQCCTHHCCRKIPSELETLLLLSTEENNQHSSTVRE